MWDQFVVFLQLVDAHKAGWVYIKMFYNTTFSHIMLNIAMVCIANYLIVRSLLLHWPNLESIFTGVKHAGIVFIKKYFASSNCNQFNWVTVYKIEYLINLTFVLRQPIKW